MKQLSCSTFRTFTSSIIPRRSRHVGMTRKALHRDIEPISSVISAAKRT
jgi:hypothetical protein